MSSRSRVVGTLRNTLLLSVLLGLTWIVALFPYSLVQQYLTVLLNGSMGLYILGYSVVANSHVRLQVKESVSGRVSDLVSSYLWSEKSTGPNDKKRFMLKKTMQIAEKQESSF